MTTMPDKGITQNITYNFLNLPTQIKQNTNTTNYIYRANDVKLKKTYNLVNASGSKIINTEYLDGFQYSTPNIEPIRRALEENDDATLSAKTAGNEEAFLPLEDRLVAPDNPDVIASILSFFPTAEGYYDYENFRYIYQYKDHLGNVRVSFVKNSAGDLQVMDTNDYYPFGLSFMKPFGQSSYYDPMAIPYNYKYNGKELQETGFVSMDYRQYAPDTARFISQDRLSEVMPDWTPYRFAFNNPVYFSDPTGLFEETNAFAHCPTCPDTPEFKPYIDDPNEVYVYNSETNTASLKETPIEEVIVGNKKQEYNQTGSHYLSQTLRKTSGYAFSANKMLFQPAFQSASQYGNPKPYTTTTIAFEKSLPKILGGRRIIYQPIATMNAIKAGKVAKGLKVAGRVVGVAGLGLGVYDMTQNGVTTSNSLDVTMSALALTPTGVTQGIAATYFLLNGVTILVTGQDIGQHMDENGYNL